MIPVHEEGWKIIIPSLVFIIGLWMILPSWIRPFVAVGGLLVLSFLLFFFRDPERNASSEGLVKRILAPSDGTIFNIETTKDRQKIYVYLSPLDVHVNRIPCDGTIQKVEYRPGTFSLAWTNKASKENESCLTEIRMTLPEAECGDNIIGVRQIAGRLARQIVNNLKVGQSVKEGERFGIIRFGSQVEISLPTWYRIKCRIGDRLVGGETQL